jgi:arsenate reductase
MRANQLRLWFASMAYVLVCALRRIGLAHTQFAEATCGTIRLKLLKIGALVRISVRRIKFAMASACPYAQEWRLAAARLLRARGSPGLAVRQVLREKGTPFHELGLGDPTLSDDALLDSLMAHPILLNRPLVITPKGVRLCRPSEVVVDLLPPQRGEFIKEDGERVIDERGRRVATA